MQREAVNKEEYTDFFKSAFALKGSVTPRVFKYVLIMILYAIAVSFLNLYYPSMSLPMGPFEYGGLVMGTILVFRVNAGYDRWWEARKIWGNIVNQSRNLTIIVLNYSALTDMDKTWKMKVTNDIAALPYLMKNHLRGQSNLEEVVHLLEQPFFEKLKIAEHKPNVLMQEIAYQFNQQHQNKRMDSFSFLEAEQKRAQILDAHGASERILKTPMPFVMAVKSRRFIFLFLIALPFALVNVSLWISPIISGLVAYTLFSLDQIGVELQNPFSEERLSHLPLNDICKTIEKNIKELQSLNI